MSLEFSLRPPAPISILVFLDFNFTYTGTKIEKEYDISILVFLDFNHSFRDALDKFTEISILVFLDFNGMPEYC